MRARRQEDRAESIAGDEVWNSLDETDKKLLIYMSGKRVVTTAELAEYVGKSKGTISKHLNYLISLNLVRINGNKYDFNHTYELVTN